MENTKKYFSFDLGTENIGFAVTDEDYKVAKVHGRKAWGVRVFDTADTAEQRRNFRTSRRRLERRKYRIILLQELFSDEILELDDSFFIRLNENDLHREDRTLDNKFSLFNDKGYTDKQYYKKYKTIYHLRDELLTKPADDIRLLYLAVHHIIKYRGNFLKQGTIGEVLAPTNIFEELNRYLEDLSNEANEEDNYGIYNDIGKFDVSNLDKVSDIVKDKNISKKDKIKQVEILLGAKNKEQKAIIGSIFGNKFNICTIFGKEKYIKENLSKAEFYFENEDDTYLPMLEQDLCETDYNIVLSIKNLYDWQVLTSLLSGEENLSSAMKKVYEEHKADLKDLKYILKKYSEKDYELMFGEPVKDGEIDKKINNYTKYTGGGMYNGVKLGKKRDENNNLVIDKSAVSRNGRLGETCTKEEFYKYVKSTLVGIKVNEEDKTIYDQILNRIENNTFMPKIVSKNNGTIPYQLNEMELKKILDVSSEKYPFLNKIENGISIKDKILSLLTFRVPYYVGPLKKTDDNSAWIVRKDADNPTRITPWNFDEKVDKEASKKLFIERMTNNCTYLKFEKVLPKNSILYSKFIVLSELNKLKINDEPISVELKQALFENVYKQKTANITNIKKYIVSVAGNKDIRISGFNDELKGNMSVYQKIKKVINDKIDKYPAMVEDMIFFMTIFADDSKMIESMLPSEQYKDILTKDEKLKLKGYKYNGWGRLSQGLLQGSAVDEDKGIVLTDSQGNKKDIIDIMWETNLNLNEIINSKEYDFDTALEKYNLSHGIVEGKDITYDDIKELNCSPSIKRSIWQAFLMTKELVSIFDVPSKIFIESTRTNNDKLKRQQSLSRKDQLINLYTEAKKVDKLLYKDRIAEMQSKLEKKENSELNAEKIFLYFMQLGKDMYSGKSIDLDELSDYDIDHIIPQSRVKDDSLNNKVLVRKNLNSIKDHEYPLKPEFRQKELWSNLHKLKLITDAKYERLTRTTPITELEQEKFINRQLVETSQIVKLTKDILSSYFAWLHKTKGKPNVEIILSKAGNVSDFRKDYNLTKSREVNDFHHAVDAYLNIVVGNVLNERFNHSRDYNNRQNALVDNKNDDFDQKSYNFRKTFERNVYSARGDRRCIWYCNKSNTPTIKVIEKELNSIDFTISKKLCEGKGELYGATIFKASNNPLLYSRVEKTNKNGEYNPRFDTTKYGGYKTSGTAYFVVVDSVDKKGNDIRSIVDVPIYYAKKIGKSMTLEQYVKTSQRTQKLNNPHLAKIDGLKQPILYAGSLFDFGKYQLRLAGANEIRLLFHNANELHIGSELNRYVKELSIVNEKINKEFNKRKSSKGELADEEFRLQIFNELAEDKTRREAENQKLNITHITKEDNLKLYDFMLEKVSNEKSPYTHLPAYGAFREVLTKGRECFAAKSEYEGMNTLLKLIVAFQCNPKKVDAGDLFWVENGKQNKGGNIMCSITQPKKLFGGITFISQSVTGLNEKRIKLS